MLKLSEITIINHPEKENGPFVAWALTLTASVIPPSGARMLHYTQGSGKMHTQREHLKLQAQEELDAFGQGDPSDGHRRVETWTKKQSRSLSLRFNLQLPIRQTHKCIMSLVCRRKPENPYTCMIHGDNTQTPGKQKSQWPQFLLIIR